MKNDNPIWHIALFKKISKDEAECIVCRAEGKAKYSFKLCHASVKSLIGHMGLHSPEYAEKYNALKNCEKVENKITNFVPVNSGGKCINV